MQPITNPVTIFYLILMGFTIGKVVRDLFFDNEPAEPIVWLLKKQEPTQAVKPPKELSDPDKRLIIAAAALLPVLFIVLKSKK